MKTIDSYFKRQPISNIEKYLNKPNEIDIKPIKANDKASDKATDKATDKIISIFEKSLKSSDKNPENLQKSNKSLFYQIPDDVIRVYTDGACTKNGSKHAKAGIGIFFGENDPRNVSKKVIGKQTNNIAELQAIILAYKILENEINNGKIIRIYSDSQYSIRCCTTYGSKCHSMGWKGKDGPIPNLELVKEAYGLFKSKQNVKLVKVEAHTGKKDRDSIGNEWADKLASQAIGVDVDNKITKVYLKVPYSKKDQIKGIGGKWEPKKKKWYMMSNVYEKKSDLVESILKSS